MISPDPTQVDSLLRDLVRAPSHPGIERQEEAAARVLHQFLSDRGLRPELKEVRPGRPNVLVRLDAPASGPTLLLCGHTDTVPPNRGMQGDPFSAEIREGRMHGRGTVDMKGALAAMACAVSTIAEGNLLPAGSLCFAAVIDEEMESLGAEDLIYSGFQADGAVVGEPTRNMVALGHKGLEWLEARFTGKATHGGTMNRGINAITAAARFISLAEKELLPRLAAREHPLLGNATLNFGKIGGGDQPSTVAAECRLQMDRRWLPSEVVEGVFSEIEALLAEVRKQMPGLATELQRVPGSMATLVHSPLELAADHALALAAFAARATVCGDAGEAIAFPAWTDGSLLANYGEIPTLICGPGDLALAHSPEESILLSDVREAARIYLHTALNFVR